MRLVTIRAVNGEEAAVVTPAGALPVREIGGFAETPDLLSLLVGGRFYELKDRYEKTGLEELADRAVPLERVAYGPPLRRPRKIWGIGLNYVEHAGDLSEKVPSDEPASFMKPDTTIVGPGDEILLPPQSERTTGEAELGIIVGREAKDVPEDESQVQRR